MNICLEREQITNYNADKYKNMPLRDHIVRADLDHGRSPNSCFLSFQADLCPSPTDLDQSQRKSLILSFKHRLLQLGAAHPNWGRGSFREGSSGSELGPPQWFGTTFRGKGSDP